MHGRRGRVEFRPKRTGHNAFAVRDFFRITAGHGALKKRFDGFAKRLRTRQTTAYDGMSSTVGGVRRGDVGGHPPHCLFIYVSVLLPENLD